MRNADELITRLVSCPEAVDLCADVFARAYQEWREGLFEGQIDYLPVATATGDDLFRKFLALLARP